MQIVMNMKLAMRKNVGVDVVDKMKIKDNKIKDFKHANSYELSYFQFLICWGG